jgi:hypothetical protein
MLGAERRYGEPNILLSPSASKRKKLHAPQVTRPDVPERSSGTTSCYYNTRTHTSKRNVGVEYRRVGHLTNHLHTPKRKCCAHTHTHTRARASYAIERLERVATRPARHLSTIPRAKRENVAHRPKLRHDESNALPSSHTSKEGNVARTPSHATRKLEWSFDKSLSPRTSKRKCCTRQIEKMLHVRPSYAIPNVGREVVATVLTSGHHCPCQREHVAHATQVTPPEMFATNLRHDESDIPPSTHTHTHMRKHTSNGKCLDVRPSCTTWSVDVSTTRHAKQNKFVWRPS